MTTARTMSGSEGRLFPPFEPFDGWSISAQADKAGYQCEPKLRLDHLEDYDSVEVAIYGPFEHRVDVTTLGLPAAIISKFPSPDDNEVGPQLGRNITLDELEVIKEVVRRSLSENPNSGIPTGNIVWSGRQVFHGTDGDAVDDIMADGIDIDKCGKGYFGKAFYVADDEDLARSNYAEFADEEAGGVVELRIADEARILDLRNSSDFDYWVSSGLCDMVGRDDIHIRAKRANVSGVYDRSVGGLAIYDPEILDVVSALTCSAKPLRP